MQLIPRSVSWISAAFCPPKPKLVETAVSTGISPAQFEQGVVVTAKG